MSGDRAGKARRPLLTDLTALPLEHPHLLSQPPSLSCLGWLVIGMINLPAQLASSNQSLVFRCNLIPLGGGGAEELVEKGVRVLLLPPTTASEWEGGTFQLPPSLPLPTSHSPSHSHSRNLTCVCLSLRASLFFCDSQGELPSPTPFALPMRNLSPEREAGTGSRPDHFLDGEILEEERPSQSQPIREGPGLSLSPPRHPSLVGGVTDNEMHLFDNLC